MGCGIAHPFRACVKLKGLERPATEGESPVGEWREVRNGRNSQVPSDTWNLMGIWGDHPPRLNTSRKPIVNQYREGKAKRTPEGE